MTTTEPKAEAALPERPQDDRSPFAAAEAVRSAIKELSTDLKTDEAVLEALAVTRLGHGSQQYVEAIARTGHSVFYHQLQALYQFGREAVPEDREPDFCFHCGRVMMETVFPVHIHSLLEMALARPGVFQARVSEMIHAQLVFYGGEKYVFRSRCFDESIEIQLNYQEPEQVRSYLASYSLDVEQCFKNSFEMIAGAMMTFCEKIVADYDSSRFRYDLGALEGTIHLPIGEHDHFSYESLIHTLLGYIDDLNARQEAARIGERLESSLMARSEVMRRTWERIQRASRSDEIVLLRGESGTGKSFYARKVHDLSPRSDRPFVEVGLTADLGSDNMILSDLFGHEKGAFTGANELKQGLFSLADGGTIFLDEIGDASAELQAKLLRVLESSRFKRLGGVRDNEVDVRVITATNCDLEKAVEKGTFRQDLYYRLSVIPIHLPSLRERREDIPALAEFLLVRSQGKGPRRVLAEGLAERFCAYDWPGNIRELDHALKHAVAMSDGDPLVEDDLPEIVRKALSNRGPAPAVTPGSSPSSAPGQVIDTHALRHEIRTTNPVSAGDEGVTCPAHIDFAKRTWLEALIDECRGDLGLIARFWDRSSEKTLRNLIRSYGLAERLHEARGK